MVALLPSPLNRSLAQRALEARDALLTEHLATLRRVRRLVLDGSLVRREDEKGGVKTANIVATLRETTVQLWRRLTPHANSLTNHLRSQGIVDRPTRDSCIDRLVQFFPALSGECSRCVVPASSDDARSTVWSNEHG